MKNFEKSYGEIYNATWITVEYLEDKAIEEIKKADYIKAINTLNRIKRLKNQIFKLIK